jgi:hypothetical protein
MTSTIEKHSDAATALLDYMSEICEQETNAGWVANWCSQLEAENDPRLRELQKQAQGRWIDVPAAEEDDTGHRYIPHVHFVYFDECQNCHKRKTAHAPDSKCLFAPTQYLPRSLHV